MFDIATLGERLRLYRRRIGLTQAELADRIGVSFQAVSGWERGSALPDIENLCRLSEVFGVSLDSMMKKGSPENGELMIAVDGGGTSAEFALFTSEGHILTSFKLPGTNASVIGVEAAYRIFCQGIDLCLSTNPHAKRVLIGNAGSKLQELREKLAKRYPDVRFEIDSDAINALKSAEGDAALICGTGSIVMHEEADGCRFVGGWGYRIGDPGSAYNFGREVLRGVTENELVANAPILRRTVGDRALLRAIHFVRENARVAHTAAALRTGDVDTFLSDVLASGRSSFQYLQNVYTVKNVEEQGLSLALAVAEGALADKGCAWRVHGGGFAGTTQAFVKAEYAEGYRMLMDSVFGEGACMMLAIRPIGAMRVEP